MKKYNLSEIMKRAWTLVKKASKNRSEALKQAWREAKAALEIIKFERRAKVVKIDNGRTNPNVGTDYDSECNYLTFNHWKKGSLERIYINDYKGRSVGYIDVASRNVITDTRATRETAHYFMQHYAF